MVWREQKAISSHDPPSENAPKTGADQHIKLLPDAETTPKSQRKEPS
jgi:hypothetical protein